MKRLLLVVLMLSMVLHVGCTKKKDAIEEVNIPNASSDETSKKDENKDAKNPVKIVFWDENAGPNRTPFYKKMIEEFNQANPDIEVEYVGIPWKSAKEKYDVAIASGKTPDVAGVPTAWVANFVMRDALLDLDPYFAEWDEKNEFNSNYIEFNRGLVTDKKLYQLPKSANTGVIWYRKDIFKEKGIEVFKDWDGFYDGVDQLTDDDMYGFSIRGGAGGAAQLITYLVAYIGADSFFDEDGKVFLRDPLAVEALERLVSIYNKKTPESDVTNGYKEMVATFDTGKAAMIQHNLGSYGEHSKTLGEGAFSAMALPRAKNGMRSVVMGGANGTAIFANTKHPDEAWRFVAFLSSKENISYWNENVGQLPTRQDINDDPWMKEQEHIGISAKVLTEDNVKIVRDANYLPGYVTVLKEIGEPGLQAVLLGEMDSKVYIDSLIKALEKEYDEFLANN